MAQPIDGADAGTDLGLVTDRAVVMGVLNVTADSFSDGGRYLDLEAAVARGRALVAAGADLIDIGGESTRPGAHRVPPEVEQERVVPVIAELARAGAVCSVDTTRSSVAAAALDAGAAIVNDVSGGLADPEMASVVAQAGVPWILMHWRGHSADMDALARYDDVVAEVRAELLARVDAALTAGIAESAIVLDPGLGFAKTAAHNWSLLRALPQLTGLDGPGWGFPVLIGASRKRFLGTLLADSAGSRPPAGREDATTAISALAAADGVWGVRVHETAASLDAVRVAAASTGRGPVRTLSRGVVAAHRLPDGGASGHG
jgi:dihydropteroate synthase